MARYQHQHQQTVDHIEMPLEVAVVAKKLRPKQKLIRSKQAVEQSSESEAGSGGSRGSGHYTTPAGNGGAASNKVETWRKNILKIVLLLRDGAEAAGRGAWPRGW